jgi:hypothetical protein
MAKEEYDIAISFAGEDRPQAEELAGALKKLGIKTFYDADEKVTLWGKDLYAHLANVYQNQAQFCVIRISQHDASKQWATQERQAMQARAFRQDGEYPR